MEENNNFKILKRTNLNDQERMQLLDLWNNEYPEKISYKSIIDFNNYLLKLSNLTHLLMIDKSNNILGWAFSFNRDNERWFAIIISEEQQRKGLGQQMLNELKKSETILNGWVIDHNNDKKINGEVYNSPLGFYRKNDFNVLKNERLELENLSAVKIKWGNMDAKK